MHTKAISIDYARYTSTVNNVNRNIAMINISDNVGLNLADNSMHHRYDNNAIIKTTRAVDSEPFVSYIVLTAWRN